jgi:RNA polymerase sigma-70 factor (ECF subfamily)
METLLRRHYDRIYAVCRRIAGNDDDANDATQEALINITRRLDRFDGRSAFSTWVYRVATNTCLDELRRRKRRPTPGLPEFDDGATDDRRLADQAPDSSEQLATRMEIDEALAELPEDFRAPVVLRDLCDLDYAEIGEILGIPPGTVRSRISRGRATLAKTLQSGNRDAP